MDEIVGAVNKNCRGCEYWTGAFGPTTPGMRFCHFLLRTNKRRVIGEDGTCLSYSVRKSKKEAVNE